MVGILAVMRISEPTFFILTALTERPLHGYGVMLAVRELPGGRLDPRPGTLCTALDRLAEDGLFSVDREETVNGRPRRYYRLTDAGAAGLAAEVARVRSIASIAAARLRRRGAPGLGLAGGS